MKRLSKLPGEMLKTPTNEYLILKIVSNCGDYTHYSVRDIKTLAKTEMIVRKR